MLDHLLAGTPRLSSPYMRARRVTGFVMRSLARVPHWIELHRQREQLDELDDHQLADLGLSRTQVRKECAKRPWQT
jgi:uncharacterized protein YjiS (DUF1127 family)